MSVKVEHITKIYGRQKALDDVSFEVKGGQVVGFLGPNGAGKSTMMKIVTCFIPQTSGAVTVCGFDVTEQSVDVRKNVGYLPEHNPLYHEMYVKEYLDFIADVRGIPYEQKKERIARFVDALDLEGKQGDMISSYSQGMKQKVAIIGALLHRPRVLLMDEPLNGLDPKSARLVKELIHGLAREGVSVMFSTHILEIA